MGLPFRYGGLNFYIAPDSGGRTAPQGMTYRYSAERDRLNESSSGAYLRRMPSYKPLTVALMNDYEIVVRGLARMLEPFSDRIEVVELAIAAPSTTPVDVALYDTFAADKVFGREVQAERFVMYSVETSDHFVSAARANGADGVLSKSLSPEQLVEALERIRAGEFLVLTGSGVNESNGDWPARSLGLSEREAEIVSLITLGLGNEDIADRLFLSINTVKSYIRTAYRKMGVTSRSKAVLRGVDHGFKKPRAGLGPDLAGPLVATRIPSPARVSRLPRRIRPDRKRV